MTLKGADRQWRVSITGRAVFANGGHLDFEDFRLDWPHDHPGALDVCRAFVRQLNLLMVSRVHLDTLAVIQGAHKAANRGLQGSSSPAPLHVSLSEPLHPTDALPPGGALPAAFLSLDGHDSAPVSLLTVDAVWRGQPALVVHGGAGLDVRPSTWATLSKEGLRWVISDAQWASTADVVQTYATGFVDALVGEELLAVALTPTPGGSSLIVALSSARPVAHNFKERL